MCIRDRPCTDHKNIAVSFVVVVFTSANVLAKAFVTDVDSLNRGASHYRRKYNCCFTVLFDRIGY